MKTIGKLSFWFSIKNLLFDFSYKRNQACIMAVEWCLYCQQLQVQWTDTDTE